MKKYNYKMEKNKLSKKDYFYVEIPNEEIILKFDDTSKLKQDEIDNLIDSETDKFLANRKMLKQLEIDKRQAEIELLQKELALLKGEG